MAGVEPFETDDELYLSEHADRDALQPLLHTTWSGTARGFVESDWTTADDRHLVMYLRELGAGAVLYNTLGTVAGTTTWCRCIDYYPKIERGSWDQPAYAELLRRSLRWAAGRHGVSDAQR